MAPTLKNITANPSTEEATQGKIEEIVGSNIANGEIHPIVSDNSNEAVAPANNAESVSSTSSTLLPTARMTIEREDPNAIPPDEMAFVMPPHFSASNPFHQHLSNLDHSMRCAICKGLYRAPVTLLPCLHNFCSLCIRNHLKATYTGMKRKAECPQCHEAVAMPGSSDYERGILPNKGLEAIVDNYKQCRDPMRESLVELDVLKKEKAMGILTRSSGDEGGGKNPSKTRGHARGMRSSKRVRRAVAKKPKYSSDSEVESDVAADNDESDEEYDDDHSNLKMPAKQPTTNFTQPSQKPQPPAQQQLKRKATVSYHSMNRKKLAELCQKEGLNTQGNEKELKQRHSDYITLYNSECDSDHPRPVKELIKEIQSREKSIKIEANKAVAKKQSQYMKKLGSKMEKYTEGEITKLTSGNGAFDTKMNNNFAAMIEAVRKRENRKPPPGGKPAPVKSNGDLEGSANEVDGDADTNQEAEGHSAMSTSQQMLEEQSSFGPEAASELGRNEGEATSPTASIDSDKTVETPSQYRQNGPRIHPANASSTAAASATKKRAPPKKSKPKSAKKSKAGSTTSRIPVAGNWTCHVCTYFNERNVTKKAICEMCTASRPAPLPESEIVNIDC